MSSKAHPPPVPPANRAPQERGKASPGGPDPRQAQNPSKTGDRARDTDSDNLAVNTHHQGYQQDR